MLELHGCCLKEQLNFSLSSVAAFQPVIFDLLSVACCCLLLPTWQAIQSKGLQTKTAGRSLFLMELAGVRATLGSLVWGPTVASYLLTVFLSCWQWIGDRVKLCFLFSCQRLPVSSVLLVFHGYLS